MAKTYYRGVGNPYDKLVKLANRGREFFHTHTTATTRIQLDNDVYIFGGGDYTFKEFQLQKQLKKEMMENIEQKSLDVPDLGAEDISYINYSKFVKNMPISLEYTDVVGFDINKAYYQCAYNLGYMSYEMYEKCIHLPKKIRLRFIGTIATSKRTYHKQGWKNLAKVQISENPLLRNVWFHICSVVDECLKEFTRMVGDDFLLYYVDGIYLKNRDYSEVLKHLYKKYNFTFKKERVKKMIRVHRNEYDTYGLDIYKFDDKTRKFERKEFTFKRTARWHNDNMANLIEKKYGLKAKGLKLSDLEQKLMENE